LENICMSEEDKKEEETSEVTKEASTASNPDESATEEVAEKPTRSIKVPAAQSEDDEDTDPDIVAMKPGPKERQSAVIGKVERPSELEKRASSRSQHRRPGGGGGRRGSNAPVVEEDAAAFEKVVHINRCAKVVAGGRRFSFSALVVVGNQDGSIGVGYGKAKEVPECIRKGTEKARKNMEPISLRNNTIPHQVIGKHDGGRVLLRPAVPGTGVIAGGGVRAVLEAAGIKDVLTKSLRSNNPAATVFATLDALRQLRSLETIKKLRKAE
jgi:small subunit ribosomal protein S5